MCASQMSTKTALVMVGSQPLILCLYKTPHVCVQYIYLTSSTTTCEASMLTHLPLYWFLKSYSKLPILHPTKLNKEIRKQYNMIRILLIIFVRESERVRE